MKYFYIFILFMLLSCEGETYVEYNKTVTAVFNYSINTNDSIYIDFKTINITDLAAFLASSANGSLPNHIQTINIQSINLKTITNSNNTAIDMDVKTQVGRIPCEGGQIENLTQFTTERNIPLIGGLADLWTTFKPLTINPEGVATTNSIIASILPAKSNRGPNNYWAQNCGSLAVYVNAKINPVTATTSMNLEVAVKFNIIYGNCEEDPFYNALAPGATCEF
ncbi:MAG: hypothetical protein HKO89_06315 [Saprospiraceae bacterium]|nr:hypothetical protein [Saprospiraceae bacterium]